VTRKTLRDVGGHIRNSAKRTAALIDDMLDFAKGRLGGGLSLDRDPGAPLHEHLEQVIGELRDVSENAIEAQITLLHSVNSDPKRIAQRGPPRQTRLDSPCKFPAFDVLPRGSAPQRALRVACAASTPEKPQVDL
jgi:hypothetical protein